MPIEEELLGKYIRLRRELAEAYTAPLWRNGHIDRLALEIAQVERAMSDSQPLDEQTNDWFPGMQ